MNPQNIRIMKEARPLLWPWCGVMLLAALRPILPVAHYGTLFDAVAIGGLYLGIPLLAGLSFGNEFQYRTLSLLLAGPVSRSQVWREKLIVMLFAVTSAAGTYFILWRSVLEEDIVQWVFTAAFLLAVICSSAVWILIARSTVGGVILNVGVQGIVVGSWVLAAQTAGARHQVISDAFPILAVGFACTVCYAAAMLWIGRRKLAYFQVTGEITANDFLPSLLQSFRWQPAGVTLNLIKKEIFLLRPVWLLTVLAMGAFLCLMPLRFFSFYGRDAVIADAGLAIAGMYLLLAGILAGSLPMGEERQLGTHSWHLTLPSSLREQWLIKLVSSTVTMAGGAFGVLHTAAFLLGPAYQKAFLGLIRTDENLLLFVLLTVTLPAFWCSCAVRGTVRAAAWTIPAAGAFFAAVNLGIFGLPFAIRMLRPIILTLHAFPASRADWGIWGVFVEEPIIFFGLPILFAIFQSYRLFRREQPDATRAIVLPLAQVCLVTFLCCLPIGLLRDLVYEIGRQEFIVLREVGEAVERLPLDPATLDAAHPKPIAPADLARVYPLSNVSEAWLRNASITVFNRPSDLPLKIFRNGKFQESDVKVVASLRFANGFECRAAGTFGGCKDPQDPYMRLPLFPLSGFK